MAYMIIYILVRNGINGAIENRSFLFEKTNIFSTSARDW